MRDLGLDGLSDDGRYVLLRGDGGEQFRVPVEDTRRVVGGAPVHPEHARPAPTEMSRMSSQPSTDVVMRPRDIQSRIRAGESPEAVAAVAQMTLERVLTYAGPVLAEREHVGELARRSALRRKHASGTGRLLGEAVDAHLRGRGLDPEHADWDAWRRADGRWSVTVLASKQGEPATFLYDQPGRYVVAHDDAARRLVGDEPPLSVEPEPDEPRMPVLRAAPPAADQPDAEVRQPEAPEPETAPAAEPPPPVTEEAPPRGRTGALDRLRRQRSTHPRGEQLLFDATPEPMVDVPADDAVIPQRNDTDDVEALARAVGGEQPTPPEAGPDPGPDAGQDTGQDPAADGVADQVVADESETGRQRRRKERRRTSVPSWDEIMFGSRPPS